KCWASGCTACRKICRLKTGRACSLTSCPPCCVAVARPSVALPAKRVASPTPAAAATAARKTSNPLQTKAPLLRGLFIAEQLLIHIKPTISTHFLQWQRQPFNTPSFRKMSQHYEFHKKNGGGHKKIKIRKYI